MSKSNQGYSSIYSLVMDRIIESTPLFYGFVLLLQAIPGLHYTVITLTCVIIVQQILLILGEKNTYTTLLKVRLSENVFMKSSFGQNTNENISEISVLYCL